MTYDVNPDTVLRQKFAFYRHQNLRVTKCKLLTWYCIKNRSQLKDHVEAAMVKVPEKESINSKDNWVNPYLHSLRCGRCIQSIEC